MKVFALGVRNLRRNLRRTLVTTLSIAFGFAAIALFAGYTKTVYRSLEDQAVYGELLGHLTVAKEGFYGVGRLDPSKFLLSRRDVERIFDVVGARLPGSIYAPRLGFSGLLSNGKVSTIFVGESLAPEAMQALRGPRSRASGGLDGGVPAGVTLSRGLAGMMGLHEGDEAAMLVSTTRGQANAVDVQVTDTFSTGNTATNDKFVYAPLALAQSLLDAEGQADRLTILLPDAADTEWAKNALESEFSVKGDSLTVGTWQDLSAFYRQVKALFDRVLAFLLGIVLVIVAMSVANAMGMSVVERTREIGTLRAIGLRRAGVIRLFMAESIMLTVLGCFAGLLITLGISYGVNAAEFTYRPPNATEEVPLLIGFDLVKATLAGLTLVLLGAAAAFVPAHRAASRPIVDSLIHV